MERIKEIINRLWPLAKVQVLISLEEHTSEIIVSTIIIIAIFYSLFTIPKKIEKRFSRMEAIKEILREVKIIDN
jgi:uncharacterized membrane protein